MRSTGLADRGYAVPTLRRYVSAIGAAHVSEGLDDPTKAPLIAALIDGIARARGTASEGKAALSPAELSRIVAALPETWLGVRDRAIHLLGFSSALRRGELAELDLADLRFNGDGVELVIRASKTDQRRAGARVFVPTGGALCPVRALERWLAVSGIEEGALFRRISRADRVLAARLSGQGIATAIKRAGEAAGLDLAGRRPLRGRYFGNRERSRGSRHQIFDWPIGICRLIGPRNRSTL